MSNQQKLFTGAMAVLVTLAGAGVLARQTSSQTAPATAPRAKPMDLETILLWPDGAPAALGSDDSDKPSVTVYLARQPNGTAIVVAPGGGYGNLAANHEGRQVANLLNAAGVTAFVLKYRLGPRYHHPVELGDAQRAIRLVRARAAEFGILGDRIGMLGFSAGGHLTATAGTRFDTGRADAPDPIDRVSSRPDFLVLAYPVISFDPAITHSGSVRNLLGDKPDPKLLEDLSADRQVTAQTPPTFLFHTDGDTGVVPENSVRFYLALRRARVPAELHIFEKGPHGVGLAMNDPALGAWPSLLTTWLRGRGLLAPAAR
jgi:acetyl esterase/lipase